MNINTTRRGAVLGFIVSIALYLIDYTYVGLYIPVVCIFTTGLAAIYMGFISGRYKNLNVYESKILIFYIVLIGFCAFTGYFLEIDLGSNSKHGAMYEITRILGTIGVILISGILPIVVCAKLTIEGLKGKQST